MILWYFQSIKLSIYYFHIINCERTSSVYRKELPKTFKQTLSLTEYATEYATTLLCISAQIFHQIQNLKFKTV